MCVAPERVMAERTASGISVDCTTGKAVLASNVNAMTHWNPKIFEGPVFNPQTGKMLKVRTTREGANRWIIRGEYLLQDSIGNHVDLTHCGFVHFFF